MIDIQLLHVRAKSRAPRRARQQECVFTERANRFYPPQKASTPLIICARRACSVLLILRPAASLP